MRLRTYLLASFMALVGVANSFAAKTLAVIPKPVSMVAGTGEFTFQKGMTLSYPAYTADSVKDVCTRFAADFKTATGISLTLAQNSATANVAMTLDTKLAAEAYTLKVTTTGIAITASHPAGFYYALQTLKQLMPRNVMAVVADESVENWTVPAVTITDKPRYGWRGFMLDEGRHFFGKDEVKRVIDILSTYKMNRFHWHLTEDQGWRIEIKKYPKLTSVGAWRNSKVLAYGATKVDGIHYGGFYTQDDVKEIVEYAKERFVEIMPEIDMPGHSQAAVASYPELLACDPAASHSVWTSQGISTDVINVCNPKAVQFAKDVIDELIPLFPFGYIHVGGDECPTGKWSSNTACQDTLAALGSTNYRDLQLHFYKQLQQYIATKSTAEQRKLIFWNEVLGGNLTYLTNPTIMAWSGGEPSAFSHGFNIIHSPQVPYYINRRQSTDPGEPKTQGSGSETVQAVYNHTPTASYDSKYLGMQGNFWTEWVIETDTVEYLMLPRIAAIAETGWTPQANKNYNDFVDRIRQDSTLYQLRNWCYGKHIFPVVVGEGPAFMKSTALVTDLSNLKSGDVVLFENARTTDAARTGFLNSTEGGQILATKATFKTFTTDYSPYMWKVVKTGDNVYSFENLNSGLYFPPVTSGGSYTVSKTAGTFNIEVSSAANNTWKISNTVKTGNYYWDGLGNGSFTGWSAADTPFKIYKVEMSHVPYYRLTNASTQTNMTASATAASMATADASDANQIWQVAANTTYTAATANRAANPYVIYSPTMNVVLNGSAAAVSQTGAVNSAYAVTSLGSEQYSLKSGAGKYTAASGATLTDETTAAANAATAWTLEPATELLMAPKTVNSKIFASVGLPYAVTLPTGVKAYYVSQILNGYAQLKEFTGTTLPANTSFVLLGDDLTPYYLTPSATAGTAVSGTNLFKTTGATAMAAPADGYYLVGGKGLVKGTATQIPAYTTYVPMSSVTTADALSFTFGDLTGINALPSNTATTAIYDISGRRVANPSNGVYIVNGKKVVY